MENRDQAVDILKFLAAIFITNSHLGILYGNYSYLATGGAIGDTLFFFCSGYTLLLGRKGDFFNWYKKRVRRIYPTVFAWMLVCCVTWNWQFNLVDILLHGGGWFVECIMIYYILIWLIQKYFIHYLKTIFVISSTIIAIRYFYGGTSDLNTSIYGSTMFKYWIFFLSMLSGSMLGLKRRKDSYVIGNTYKNLFMLAISTIIFYLLFYSKNINGFEWLQILTIFPLIGFANYLYKLCSNKSVINLLSSKITGFFIKCIGGLCLEIYLVQSNLITDKFNVLFPLNIPFMFIIIIISAYCLRCLSRFWQQTFSETDYKWEEIVNPY